MRRYSIDVWILQSKHEMTYSSNANDLLAAVSHISTMAAANSSYGEVSHIRIRELNYQKQVKYFNRLFIEIPLSEWERLDKIQKVAFMIK